jgi:hypothetical protein
MQKLLDQLKVNEMEDALRSINFFVGGLTDEAIEYYYNKMVIDGKIESLINL